jgi:hypothetical protein
LLTTTSTCHPHQQGHLPEEDGSQARQVHAPLPLSPSRAQAAPFSLCLFAEMLKFAHSKSVCRDVVVCSQQAQKLLPRQIFVCNKSSCLLDAKWKIHAFTQLCQSCHHASRPMQHPPRVCSRNGQLHQGNRETDSLSQVTQGHSVDPCSAMACTCL